MGEGEEQAGLGWLQPTLQKDSGPRQQVQEAKCSQGTNREESVAEKPRPNMTESTTLGAA